MTVDSSPVFRVEDFDDPAFDPFLADEVMYGDSLDPYPRFAALRAECPVQHGSFQELAGINPDVTTAHLDHYTVFGYEEALQVYDDPVTFSNKSFEFNLGICFGRTVSVMDAPEHPRYRKIFQRAFLPNIVSKWGDELVDPVIGELIGGFRPRGKADLIREFTLHYPFTIIYRQLGLPPQDIQTFHRLAIGQIVVLFDVPHGMEASRKLGDYFKVMLDHRHRHPEDTLVGLLLGAEVDGEALPEEILISFLRQLINAGGDTTYRATSILLTALLCNPDQLDAVRKDRSLVPQAIEEALRWDGPSTIQSRLATRDVVLGGVAIPQGAIVDICAGAANRDPHHFADPDRFDIFRPRGSGTSPLVPGRISASDSIWPESK